MDHLHLNFLVLMAVIVIIKVKIIIKKGYGIGPVRSRVDPTRVTKSRNLDHQKCCGKVMVNAVPALPGL
jgi:hypothetical protein